MLVWRPSWSMDGNHFSNLSFPCPREAPNEIWATLTQRLQRRSRLKFWTFFPYKCIGKQTWPLRKKVMSVYDHYFSNFGRPPIPHNLCKDSASRHPWFWRRSVLKVFIICGYGSHLGQWTTTILASYHFPAPGRLQMKFEQHWPRGSRGDHLKFSTFFPIQMHREANLTLP